MSVDSQASELDVDGRQTMRDQLGTMIGTGGTEDQMKNGSENNRKARPRNPTWPKAAAVIATAPTSGKRARAHAMIPPSDAARSGGGGRGGDGGGGGGGGARSGRRLRRTRMVSSSDSESGADCSSQDSEESTVPMGGGRSTRKQRVSIRLGTMTLREVRSVCVPCVPCVCACVSVVCDTSLMLKVEQLVGTHRIKHAQCHVFIC